MSAISHEQLMVVIDSVLISPAYICNAIIICLRHHRHTDQILSRCKSVIPLKSRELRQYTTLGNLSFWHSSISFYLSKAAMDISRNVHALPSLPEQSKANLCTTFIQDPLITLAEFVPFLEVCCTIRSDRKDEGWDREFRFQSYFAIGHSRPF